MRGDLPVGYRLVVQDEHGRPLKRAGAVHGHRPFLVLTFDDVGNEVGHADCFFAYPAGVLQCSEVFVDPDHRRRGLATAMYVEAERVSGKIIHPYGSQYEPGRRLWQQPGRPFGRGVRTPRGKTIETG